MRAGLTVLVVGVLLGLAPAASAGVFPDLPGIDIAERAVSGKSSVASTRTTSNAAAEQAGVSSSAPLAEKDDPSAELADTQTIDALPGGGLLNLGTTAQSRTADGVVVLLGVAVVVLFTRFLFRLNALGRRPA